MPEIRLEKLIKRYGAVEVLHGIDLHMAENEFTVLVGPSGCGKRHAIAEAARQAGVVAKGDWHQLHARTQLCVRIMPTGRKSAQARTLPSLTRPRASQRTSI